MRWPWQPLATTSSAAHPAAQHPPVIAHTHICCPCCSLHRSSSRPSYIPDAAVCKKLAPLCSNRLPYGALSTLILGPLLIRVVCLPLLLRIPTKTRLCGQRRIGGANAPRARLRPEAWRKDGIATPLPLSFGRYFHYRLTDHRSLCSLCSSAKAAPDRQLRERRSEGTTPSPEITPSYRRAKRTAPASQINIRLRAVS